MLGLPATDVRYIWHEMQDLSVLLTESVIYYHYFQEITQACQISEFSGYCNFGAWLIIVAGSQTPLAMDLTIEYSQL